MKIALPLMLAWYFQKFEGRIGWKDFAIAAVLIVVPVYLIKRQPDLGTALLIAASGFYVLYLAGLSWKIIVGLTALGCAAATLRVAASSRLPARAHPHVHRPDARSARHRISLDASVDRARVWRRRSARVGSTARRRTSISCPSATPTSSSRCSARNSD